MSTRLDLDGALHFRFSGMAACGADDRRPIPAVDHGDWRLPGTSDPDGPISCERCATSLLRDEVRAMDARALAVDCPQCYALPEQKCLGEARSIGADGTPGDPAPHLERLRAGARNARTRA